MANLSLRSDEEELMAAAVHIAMPAMVQDRISASYQLLVAQQQQSESIQNLKADVERKNEEINSLRKELRDLELKNCELEGALDLKNEEIKGLRTRIQKLENEKKNLEDELTLVQNKVSRLERDLKELTASKDRQDEHNQEISTRINKADLSLARMKKELTEAKQENSSLRKEMKDIKEMHQKGLPRRQIQYPNDILPASVMTENHAVLYLGELCFQVQAKMYEEVLPKYFTSIRSYKVKSLLKDIKKLPKDEKERQEAEQKWESLKEKLNWREEYEDAMKSLQESRNREAHPPINEEILQRAVKELDEKQALKGYISHESVKALIEMWKLLKSKSLLSR